MKGKILVMGLLLLPVLAQAGQTQRNEFLGVQYSQAQTIVDVKVDCRGRYELTPEMNIELLTIINNKFEKYKAALVSTGYPDIEITVSRNGSEICRYLTKSNISAFNGVMSLKILDKMSLNGKFCEGTIGKDFEFRPSSVDKYLQYYAPMRDLTNKCSLIGKFGDATREYMNRELLKAGPVPEEITFTGILKGIFK